MNNYKDFMKGRNGIDSFGIFLFISILIIFIIDLFFKNIVLLILYLIFLIVMLYRVFSKNLYKRVKENNEYLDLKRKIINLFKKDEYLYKKCHKCHTKMRLKRPSKIGIKHVKCPTCNKRNTYIILKKI